MVQMKPFHYLYVIIGMLVVAPPLETSFTLYPGSGLQISRNSSPSPNISRYCIGVPVGVEFELNAK